MSFNNINKGHNQRQIVTVIILAFAVLMIVILPSCKRLSTIEKMKLAEKQDIVYAKWSDVENQYLRRYDLCQNFAKSAKKHIASKGTTSEQQKQARQMMQALSNTANSLKNVKIDPTDEKAIKKFLATQDTFEHQIQIAINVLLEAYPDLKANDNFIQFQMMIEGTANRISTTRFDYNEVVKDYNAYINKIGEERAANSNFKKIPLINQESADRAPVINLD